MEEMRVPIHLRHWTEPVFCNAGAGETKERAYELQVIEKNGKNLDFLRHPVWCRNQTGKWKSGHREC